jgi:hypothetical protein
VTTGERRAKTNWEMVSAISALVVGVAALFVSAFTAYEEHRHGQAEVWPHLNLGISDRDDAFDLRVSNKGLGPATLRDARITVDGHAARTWKEYVTAYAGHVRGWEIQKGPLVNVTLLPGETIDVCSAGGEIGRAFLDGRSTGAHREEIAICYCSVFEDCWVLDVHAGGSDARGETRSVPRCSTPSEVSIVPASPAEIAENFGEIRKLQSDAGR